MTVSSFTAVSIQPPLVLVCIDFGSSEHPSARKMREALVLIRERAPELEVEGEMHADAAMLQANPMIRPTIRPTSGIRSSIVLINKPIRPAKRLHIRIDHTFEQANFTPRRIDTDCPLSAARIS